MDGIAVIGLAGRFPGANNTDELWENLVNGINSITTFSDEDLKASGVPDYLLNNPNYVKKGGALNSSESFDASFFGYSTREALYIDPQHRIFLECAWEALENAGYNSEKYEGIIGVYGGCGMPYYLIKNLLSTSDTMESVVDLITFTGNEKDFLTTRVSYKMNLSGPSISVQTACSTSLVAVQLACQALLSYQCDMTLCGGVSIQNPRMKGYLYTEGQIFSKDGDCRPFDKNASGTIFGEGVGVVVLKRLEDAVADRDMIYAVIKGAAVNNDASAKVGYTAPGVDAQMNVIAMAQALANVNADEIDYIEAHGTGTPLGDAVEIAALTQAFRESTERKQFCAIGSIKSNIGHLDVAAGAVGLIKVILMLKHKKIPPTIHYRESNPELNLETSPFYVNDKLVDWETDGKTRLAGISSFGMGGTNVHVVLSEAPKQEPELSSRPGHLFILSAKTETALETATKNLSGFLKNNKEINLADAAYTLQVGRQYFKYRRVMTCQEVGSAADYLESLDAKHVFTGIAGDSVKPVVFMFTGQGSQYVNMTFELYKHLPVFRYEIDNCSNILAPILGQDIRKIIYPGNDNDEKLKNQQLLNETSLAQPALFMIEFALAKFWMSCGVVPRAMIGHSSGEYVAACLSGVFTLSEALETVAFRGQLMQKQSRGSMLAISLPEEELRPLIGEELNISVINAPSLCVVSGPASAIDNLQSDFEKGTNATSKRVTCKKLQTSHAFHSQLMEPAVLPMMEFVRKLNLKLPQIPFISNVSGTWITTDQATAPEYWAKHLRNPVRFSDGIRTLLSASDKIMLEIGPGMTLATLTRLHLDSQNNSVIFSSTGNPKHSDSEFSYLLNTLGKIWMEGIQIDWEAYYENEKRRRIPLPTYPFERKRLWIETEKREKTTSSRKTREISIFGEAKKKWNLISIFFENKIAPKKPPVTIEDKLMKIWQRVLGVKSVKKSDDFFELGGHSILAAQLFVEIENIFGKNIPLSTLYQASTFGKLAEIIKKEYTPKFWLSSIVPIRSEGTKNPIFLVHGAEGNVLLYRALASHLNKDRPVYGLQSAGLDGKEDFDPKFETVAAKYIKEIKSIQPKGPYLLGGYCLGGTIALEMAQQLYAQREKVDLLAMIEIYNIQSLKWPLPLYYRGVNIFLNLGYHLLNFISPKNETKIEFFREKAMVELNRLKVSLKVSVAKINRIFDKNSGLKYYHLKIDEAYDRALEEYYPKKYPGKISLFVPKTIPMGFHDTETHGFGDIAERGVTKYVIPVYPKGTLIEPYVKILAEKIEESIEAAEKKGEE